MVLRWYALLRGAEAQSVSSRFVVHATPWCCVRSDAQFFARGFGVPWCRFVFCSLRRWGALLAKTQNGNKKETKRHSKKDLPPRTSSEGLFCYVFSYQFVWMGAGVGSRVRSPSPAPMYSVVSSPLRLERLRFGTPTEPCREGGCLGWFVVGGRCRTGALCPALFPWAPYTSGVLWWGLVSSAGVRLSFRGARSVSAGFCSGVARCCVAGPVLAVFAVFSVFAYSGVC